MLTTHEQSREDTASLMADIGRKARAAARPLAIASAERKHAALIGMAEAILRREQIILDANAADMANGEEAKLSPAMMDRLKLTKAASATWRTASAPSPNSRIRSARSSPNGTGRTASRSSACARRSASSA